MITPRYLIWRNWPDYRRDYDKCAVSRIYESKLKKLTWLQKGLRLCPTIFNADYLKLKKLTWLQKGLRPLLCPVCTNYKIMKKLTWLQKGLRHSKEMVPSSKFYEEIDLITEGITTVSLVIYIVMHSPKKLTWLQKGLRPGGHTGSLLFFMEEIDLITEGITTPTAGGYCCANSLVKKLTWLQKGLRPFVIFRA